MKVSLELQRDVEQFLYQEARLLDAGRFEEWLELFAHDLKYWMPARDTMALRQDSVRKEGEVAYIADNKDLLVMRVRRFDTGLAHAEQPPSRTRHFVSNVEVVAERGDEVEVCSNILVYQSRLERTESYFVGSREDALRRRDDDWQIFRRKIILDQTLIPRSISIFF